MAKFYETIPESVRAWILEQKVFWVATAPLAADGHVNVSPKGGEGHFGLLDDRTFWYADYSGSGVPVPLPCLRERKKSNDWGVHWSGVNY